MKHKSLLFTFYILALAVVCLPISSCGDNDEDYLFEVSHAFDIEIPTGQNPALSVVFPFTNIQSQIAQELANRGLTTDDIISVQTARARLDLLGFDGSFSDFREVVVNTYLGPDPTFNRFEAGYTIEIQDRFSEQLDIVPSLTDLTDVLKNDVFNMEVVMTPRRVIVVPMSVRFSITFGVIQ